MQGLDSLIFFTCGTNHPHNTWGSLADLSISYREGIPLKYILERVNCSWKENNAGIYPRAKFVQISLKYNFGLKKACKASQSYPI